MSKKIVEVNIPRYLKRYIEVSSHVKGRIAINKRFPVLKSDNRGYYEAYFEKNKLNTEVFLFQMHNPHPQNIYTLIKYYEQKFKDSLLQFVSGGVLAGKKASCCINEFMLIYDISEEEYKHCTAYKAWQRSNQKRILEEFKREYALEYG